MSKTGGSEKRLPLPDAVAAPGGQGEPLGDSGVEQPRGRRRGARRPEAGAAAFGGAPSFGWCKVPAPTCPLPPPRPSRRCVWRRGRGVAQRHLERGQPLAHPAPRRGARLCGSSITGYGMIGARRRVLSRVMVGFGLWGSMGALLDRSGVPYFPKDELGLRVRPDPRSDGSGAGIWSGGRSRIVRARFAMGVSPTDPRPLACGRPHLRFTPRAALPWRSTRITFAVRAGLPMSRPIQRLWRHMVWPKGTLHTRPARTPAIGDQAPLWPAISAPPPQRRHARGVPAAVWPSAPGSAPDHHVAVQIARLRTFPPFDGGLVSRTLLRVRPLITWRSGRPRYLHHLRGRGSV